MVLRARRVDREWSTQALKHSGCAGDLQHRRDGIVFGNAIDPGTDTRKLRRARVGGHVSFIYQVEIREDPVRVFVLTDCPSPYQVELFNEIEAQGECKLEVGYLRDRDPQRQWKSSEIRHACVELNGSSARAADLVVFNYYRHAQAE